MFSENIKIHNYSENDSLKVFSKELKKSITFQLKEIWDCKNVEYNYADESKQELILDIGVIPTPPENMLDKFKLATNLILDRNIKINYNFKKGKLIYGVKKDNKIEHNEFNLFKVFESIPIINGCDMFWTQNELKKCFKNYIINHFDKNFDPEKFKNINLEKKKHQVIIRFTITEKSKIEDVFIKHENEIIKKEFFQITQKIKIDEPGYKEGKAYSIKYAIPIYFIIE